MTESAPMQDEIARHRACFGAPGTNTRTDGEDVPAPTKGAGKPPRFPPGFDPATGDYTFTMGIDAASGALTEMVDVDYARELPKAATGEALKRMAANMGFVEAPAMKNAGEAFERDLRERMMRATLDPPDFGWYARNMLPMKFSPFAIMDLDGKVSAPVKAPPAWAPPLSGSKVNASSVMDPDSVDYVPPEVVEKRKERRDLNPLRLATPHVENERFKGANGCNCNQCRAMYGKNVPEPDYSRADRDGLPAHVIGRYDIPKPTRGTMTGKAEVKGFGFTVKNVQITRGGDMWGTRPGIKSVQIHAEINSRETGAPMALYFRNDFPETRPDAACIRELLIEAVRHEIEECIFVDGVRVWDPHVNGRNEI
jgi:hypothetical protein